MKKYWNWLTTYDPDVVYSYCSLPDTLVVKIDGAIRPFQFTDQDRLTVALTHPDISVAGMMSLSVQGAA